MIRLSNKILGQEDYFGLDIGYSSLKIVQLKNKGGRIYLHGFSKITLPENLISEQGITDGKSLSEFIKRGLEEAKPHPIETRNVVVSLPEASTFNKIFKFPPMSRAELEEALRLNFQEAFSADPEDFYLDWQIINETKLSNDIFLAAAPKSLVNNYLNALQMAQLNPLALEIDTVALIRSIIPKEERQPLVILDLGYRKCGLIIFDQLPISTGTIMIGIKDLDPQKYSSQEIKDSLEEIAKQVRISLNFYKDQYKGVVKKGLLCGGGVFNKPLKDYLKNQLKINFKIATINLPADSLKPLPPNQEPVFAIAIGLSMRNL